MSKESSGQYKRHITLLGYMQKLAMQDTAALGEEAEISSIRDFCRAALLGFLADFNRDEPLNEHVEVRTRVRRTANSEARTVFGTDPEETSAKRSAMAYGLAVYRELAEQYIEGGYFTQADMEFLETIRFEVENDDEIIHDEFIDRVYREIFPPLK